MRRHRILPRRGHGRPKEGATIHVPVLVITGASDRLFPPPARPNQAALFTGSRQVTQATLPDTAHAFTLERSHHTLVDAVASWLRTLTRH